MLRRYEIQIGKVYLSRFRDETRRVLSLDEGVAGEIRVCYVTTRGPSIGRKGHAKIDTFRKWADRPIAVGSRRLLVLSYFKALSEIGIEEEPPITLTGLEWTLNHRLSEWSEELRKLTETPTLHLLLELSLMRGAADPYGLVTK